VVIQSRLKADLALLRDEMDKALDVAHQRAQQELADLKAQIRAQCEQTKSDLQDEETRATHKECMAHPKNCPNPIKAIAQLHSSSITPATLVHLEMDSNQPTLSHFSVDGSETQHACMLVDSAPEAEDTNSPTPTADVPLAVPTVAMASAITPTLDPVLMILTAIQKQMEQMDTHLKAIKTGNAREDYNAWAPKHGFDASAGIGEVGNDTGYNDYCTPK
jgi:hypothetical protein